MTDIHVVTIQIKYILTRCYICFKSFLKHRRRYRSAPPPKFSSLKRTFALNLLMIVSQHFCVFAMEVPTPETSTVHFRQTNSHPSAINRLFCVKGLFFLSLPMEPRKALIDRRDYKNHSGNQNICLG